MLLDLSISVSSPPHFLISYLRFEDEKDGSIQGQKLTSSLVLTPAILAGGAPQVVVVQGAGNAVTVVQPSGNVTSVGMAVYENLVIYVVPTVLT